MRVGWGVSLETTLARLVDLAPGRDAARSAPAREGARGRARGAGERDRRARAAPLPVGRSSTSRRARRPRADGRRVVTGGSGSRQAAFRYMLRLLGIESELALVKNRLATPPLGKMSEVEQYDALVMRLTTDKGARWLTVRDKFAPFGYIPAELREQPAIRLVDGDAARCRPRAGRGRRRRRTKGAPTSATTARRPSTSTLTFEGNRAIAWRNALDQIPQAKIYDFVERELVAPSFDGGHVREMKVDARRRSTSRSSCTCASRCPSSPSRSREGCRCILRSCRTWRSSRRCPCATRRSCGGVVARRGARARRASRTR